MKANELMIGDWVEVIQNSEKHFAQVQMIDGYGDNATSNECICDAIYYSIDELNPILLTTEIFEKNGFEQTNDDHFFDGDEYYAFDDDFDIHIDDTGNFEIRTVDGQTIKIKYVHELQHVLRICGMEKQINL